MEKDTSVQNHGWRELSDWSSRSRGNGINIIEEQSVEMGEAADIFGDLQTAEDYGYVNRGLKSRHIQFIALGGTIGTGLFLGIGRAFTQAGPLSLLLGYTFTGVAIYAMMMSLGEMATWLPLPGAIPQFCSRYVDPAMGFAVGWNSWYQSAITCCAEIAAAGVVIQFWEGARDINVAAWTSLIIILIVSLNIVAVHVYGEAEFIFSSIKIVTIVGLLLFALIIDLGGGPKHDRLGFRYWNNPGAMKAFVAEGDTGRFLALWSVLVNAAFSYGGVETVAVAAGEAANPRVNIPKAIRRVFWRILLFYVLGSLAIGVLLPYNDDLLLNQQKLGKNNSAASPWVIAAYRAAVPVLPSIINAAILTSAMSSANAYLYTGSRYLYALAQNGQAPRLLLNCSKRGVPYFCILLTASISLLAYLSCSSGSAKVFTWIQNLSTIAYQFTWMSVSIAYIRFHAALKAQNVDRSQFGYSPPPPTPNHQFRSRAYDTDKTLPLNPKGSRTPNLPIPRSFYNPTSHKSSLGSHHNALNCNPLIHSNTTTFSSALPGPSYTTASYSQTPSASKTGAGGENRYHMPFRSPWQPYLAWFSLIYFALVTLFNGFWVFHTSARAGTGEKNDAGVGPADRDRAAAGGGGGGGKGFDANNFVTAYVGIPIYFGLFLFWKVLNRTRWVRADEADIWTGKRALDKAVWEKREARNVFERLWFWLA